MSRLWLDPTADGGWRTARFIEVDRMQYYAEVTLDRDEYLHAAERDGRADAGPAPEFLDALERCFDSVTERLWIDGYPGEFNSSPRSRIWSRLPVPYALADRAVEALRAAEMDGDYAGLDSLAAEMRVPVDEWLAPGERLLQRGIHFGGAPSNVLGFLRRKARERGLRLNGRAVDGGVWLRPNMPKSTVALMAGAPELFGEYADPERYAAHVEDGSEPVRPYVGARSEPPRDWVTPTTFVPGMPDFEPDGCVCGYPGARTDDRSKGHMDGHLQWSLGMLIPRTLRWPLEKVAVVTPTSPIGWQNLAYRYSNLPRRENGYDFASFAVGDGVPRDGDTRAYLYRSGERIIGFASVIDSDTCRYKDAGLGARIRHPEDGASRPAVVVIFTAAIWRRKGVGRALIEAIAADSGIGAESVGWTTPFSTAGRALAASISPGGVWLR